MRKFMLLVLFFIPAVAAYAQIEDCASYSRVIDAIGAAPTAAAITTQAETLFDIRQNARCFSTFITEVDQSVANKVAFEEFVRKFQSSRPDKQSGASGGGTGSTSVVAQGPVAKILSVATEYGAFTQSVSGQVVTVRGNLGGLPSALVRKDIFPYCTPQDKTAYCVQGSLISILSRFSVSASFDATRSNQTVSGIATAAPSGTAQPVSFTGKKREISSLSARVELWSQRDTNSDEFKKEWASKVGEALQGSAVALRDNAEGLVVPISRIPAPGGYQDWYNKSVARLKAEPGTLSRDRVVLELRAALSELKELIRRELPEFNAREQADKALAAYSRFFLEQDALVDKLSTKSVVAFEYSNNRPTGQPETHNLRMIWDVPINKATKFAANAAVDFYNSVPADAKSSVEKFRDAQIGLQLDHGLGKNSLSSAATVSLAGYYQYQNTPAMLEVDPATPVPGITFTGLPATAKTVFTKTGSIYLAQAKLTLAPANTSAKIPVSLTYSNKTELISKPSWKAQIGITYDFDSLFSALAKH